VFPSNSHCVPIKFSICLEHVLKISNVCPQHVSISTSLYLIHFALYIYSILVTYASRPKGRRPQYICFGTVQRAFLVTAFPMVVPHHREQPLGTQWTKKAAIKDKDWKEKTTLLSKGGNYGT
jgi:hypothetical protein